MFEKRMAVIMSTKVSSYICFSLFFLIVSMLSGCSVKSASTNYDSIANSNSGSDDEGSPICAVDFKNFSFPSAFDEIKDEIVMKNGLFLPEGDSQIGASLVGIIYGDLIGDKEKEAVVVISLQSGGSALPHVVYVFTKDNSAGPTMIWKYVTGDRADDGLRSVYIVSKRLIIETYDPDGSTGDCCPTGFNRKEYIFENNTFRYIQNTKLPNPSGSAGVQFESSNCN